MKRINFYFALFLLACLAIFFIMRLSAIKQTDEEQYHALMLKSTRNKKFCCNAKQQRYHVTKHLLLTKEDERQQMKLSSLSSELTLNQQDDKTELVEVFKNIHCLMQESLIQNDDATKCKQVIRQLDADQATYHYKDEELVAEQAFLTRFLANGKELENIRPMKILIKGKASHIQLSFADTAKPFKAKNFQASIEDWGTE